MRGLIGWARARAAAALACILAAASLAEAGDVFARVSVRSGRAGNGYYGRTFAFPADVRDYSERSFYGYSFRQELASGGVRELEIARVHTTGAYLIATDLFANGRFSTMSHTVLMVFPRRDLYTLSEEPTGNLRVRAPDGSWLLIDGRSEGVLATAAFELAPQGPTGATPRLLHRGLHLEITAVGRSPFLRGTAVTMDDSSGGSCRLSTEDVFRYGAGPESDVFRYDSDGELFRFLTVRCPGLRLPSEGLEAAVTPGVQPAVFTTEEARTVPVTHVATSEAVADTITTTASKAVASPPPAVGGAVPSVVRFLSRPETGSKRTRGPTSLLSGRLW